MSSPSPSDLLAPYSACEVSDALIKLGEKSGGYLPDIRMLSPSGDDLEVRICGPAHTVKMVWAVDKDSPKPEEHFVDAAPQGAVIVISGPYMAKNAMWGGLMSAGAQSRGALGVVINGRCRDLAEHRGMGFPVFAQGTSTLGQGGFTRPSALNVPLVFEGAWVAAGRVTQVTVNSGDVIVGDVDGVVCVPVKMAGEVAEACKKGREVDEKCMADIRAGKGVAASFKLHRGK